MHGFWLTFESIFAINRYWNLKNRVVKKWSLFGDFCGFLTMFFSGKIWGEIIGVRMRGFLQFWEKGLKKRSKRWFSKQTLTKNRFLTSVSCFETTFLGFWKNRSIPCVARRQTGNHVKKGVPKPWGSVFFGFFQNRSEV